MPYVLSPQASQTHSRFSEIKPALRVLPVLSEQSRPRHSLKACTYGDLLFAAPILDFPCVGHLSFWRFGIYARSLGLSS